MQKSCTFLCSTYLIINFFTRQKYISKINRHGSEHFCIATFLYNFAGRDARPEKLVLIASVYIMLLGLFLLNIFTVAFSKAVRAFLHITKSALPLFTILSIVCWIIATFTKHMPMKQKLGWVISYNLLPAMLIYCSTVNSIRITLPHDMLTIMYAAMTTILVVTILTLLAILVILILNNSPTFKKINIFFIFLENYD
jgi:hypothetical protein